MLNLSNLNCEIVTNRLWGKKINFRGKKNKTKNVQ